ncbi:hypothetical protein ACWDZ4_13530 [Streptomyces sp. NPDC003016]
MLLAVIITLRLRLRLCRRTQARSLRDEQLTVITVLAFGVLIAPAACGQGIANVLTQLAQGISGAGS